MQIKNHGYTFGALCFVLGGLQYLLAEKITALSWTTPFYSYVANYISDLGVAQCGVMPDGRDLCSPLHAVMNGGFMIEGGAVFYCLLLAKTAVYGVRRDTVSDVWFFAWRRGRVNCRLP